MTGELMRAEMAEQPRVLEGAVDRFADDVSAVRALRPRALAGTLLLGRGSSDNAALLGRYLVEPASRRPAALAAPSLETRYGSQADYTGWVVVAFSQSGATPEVVTTADRLRSRGARLVSVTNDPASPLAEVADVVLDLRAGPERAVPATKTVTAQLLAAVVVAQGLAVDGTTVVAPDALERMPAAVEALLADATAAAELAARWQRHRRLLVVARGVLGAAAAETALKIRETAGVFAQGISSADLLHGPIAAVDRDLAVLLVHADGPTGADLAELAVRLDGVGADTAVLGRGSPPPPDGFPEALTAVLATVQGQQLALAWALAAGLDPDAPAGLSKITATV